MLGRDTRSKIPGMHTPDHRRRRAALLLALAGFVSTAALASTEAAWQAFRDDVEAGCRAAADDDGFEVETITVDPFGSRHYGLARLTGRTPGTDRRQQRLCAYDKQTKVAEVGTAMAIDDPSAAGRAAGP